MSAPALTDAAVHRLIRRILTAPSTTSDSLLVLADGLDDAAKWTDRHDAAVMLAGHASALRKLAPCFADRPPPAAPEITPIQAARILVRTHRPHPMLLAEKLAFFGEDTPLGRLLADVLAAAEIEVAR